MIYVLSFLILKKFNYKQKTIPQINRQKLKKFYLEFKRVVILTFQVILP